MIQNEQLYNQIPKSVEQWTSQDVKRWFELNKISICESIKIDGNEFKKLTPTKLVKQCQIQSHFLIRKITDWIQFQVSDFNEYVSQQRQKQQEQQQQQSRLNQVKRQQLKQNSIPPKKFKENSLQIQDICLKNLQKQQYQNQNLFKTQQQPTRISKQVEFSYQQLSPIQLEDASSDNSPNKIEKILQKGDDAQKSDDLTVKQEDNIEEVYKPMKYRANKNHKMKKQEIQSNKIQKSLSKQKKQNIIEPRKCFFKNNKKKSENYFLELNDLEQNYESNDDISTQKYIPNQQSESQSEWQPYFRQYKSQFVKKQQKNQLKKIGSKVSPSPLSQNPNIKFISSQYCVPQNTSLVLHFNEQLYSIHPSGVTKIGRSNLNDIVLVNEGISRVHAQILAIQQEQYEQKVKRYYLKDTGSKFGTFIQIDPQKPKKINQGDIYFIGSTIIQVIKVKLNKNKDKFQLIINQLNQDTPKSLIFYNKSIITLGRKTRQATSKDSQGNSNSSSQQTKRLKERIQKESKDIQLDDKQICVNHCRFVILKQEVYLEQVQGNIFQKLLKDKLYLLDRWQTAIKLGEQNALIQKESTYKIVN